MTDHFIPCYICAREVIIVLQDIGQVQLFSVAQIIHTLEVILCIRIMQYREQPKCFFMQLQLVWSLSVG